MIEKIGNIWNTNCDVIAITTNGIVKQNGELVMGKGIALQAKQRFSNLPKLWGELLLDFGNIPELAYYIDNKLFRDPIKNSKILVSLPTKHHWKDKSNIELIKESLHIIDYIINKDKTIAIPRPGCSNGGLNWKDVKKEIEPLLDDRFIIYSLK